MTLQITDFFYYEGKKLDIVGIKGSGLITVEDLKIETRSASTACWRGYIMRYEIKDNQLYMEGFWVKTPEDVEPQKINEINPKRITKEYDPRWVYSLSFRYDYRNVYLKQLFTGSLLLGNKSILEEYVHMGYPSPTSYQTVLKFDFKNGDITKVEDISEDIEDERLKGDPKGYYPDSDSSEDLKRWIEKRFSLDIDF